MAKQSLMDRVARIEGSLSAAHKLVAAFLMKSGHKAAFLTAAEIAAKVGTSESTVVRFARVLGFGGYPQLQEFLRQGLLSTLSPLERLESEAIPADATKFSEQVVEKEVGNLRAALDGVDHKALEGLVGAIVNAETCYVLGLRSSRAPATLLSHYLSKIVPKVTLIASSDMMMEQMSWVSKNDVLIAYSYPRYSKATIDALRIAKSYGARTGTITDSRDAPSAQISDFVLVGPAHSSFYGNSFVAAIALSNLLLTSCALAQPDLVRRNLGRVEEVASRSERFIRLTDPGVGKPARR
jgi:DNA-binding MurR/RpiR family transcriptional regulator